jgi:hypothetical protein
MTGRCDKNMGGSLIHTTVMTKRRRRRRRKRGCAEVTSI